MAAGMATPSAYHWKATALGGTAQVPEVAVRV